MKKKIEVSKADNILSGDGDKISINELLKTLEEYNTNKNELYLELIVDELDHGGGPFSYVSLKYDREETDEEYAIRTNREKEYLEKRKKIEYEQYLKMKEKFESNGDK